jgi:hypothetical protein
VKPYVIRQGDYLTKLAHTNGYDADTVWKHAKNKELRERRSDPNTLLPGDILWVPEPTPARRLAVKSGTDNRYTARIPKMPVSVRLQLGGEPLVKEPFRILGVGPDPIEGATDEHGWLKAEVNVHVREIEVELTARDKTLRVRVGDMDPLNTVSGVKKRLTHLGFYQPSKIGVDNDDAADGHALVSALKAFQQQRGLEPTGKMNEDTAKALSGHHGS